MEELASALNTHLNTRCIICHTEVIPHFKVSGHTIFQCPACHHQMLQSDDVDRHIHKTYDDSYFFGGGAGYPDYFCEKNILLEHGHYYGRILKKYLEQGSRILDIGSAAGFILKGISENGFNVQGIEPNATMAAYARHELGLDVQTTSLESFNTDQRFHAICLIQVIAHFCDPVQALAVCLQLLHENGLILVETWNRESLTARIFGRHWHEYSPPSVRHWFSKRGLDQFFEQANCRKIATGKRLKKISISHAGELMAHKHRNPVLSKTIRYFAGLFPKHVVMFYPSEDLFWSLYKKL